MDGFVIAVFAFVYLGMILGEIPGLALDRTGVALLGAIALLAAGRVSPVEAWGAVDVGTIGLLLGLMVVSAQFRLGGFYARVTRNLSSADNTPWGLLALLILVAGGLSALLANDIVCLAMAPVLTEGCLRRRLNPLPFLLALACASNVGSAATLIGNPQNMLIGQALKMSFAGYLADALVPSLLGLGVVWAVIAFLYRGRWGRCGFVALGEGSPQGDKAAMSPLFDRRSDPPFDPWQTGKGFLVLAGLVALFLFSPWPREVLALGAAGLLLLSRRMTSRRMLGLVDWQLLVLFAGLFVVNHAVETSGLLGNMMEAVRETGVDPSRPGWLFGLTAVFSNLVSNVPAVMLLLPAATHPLAGPVLALSSTLAGNLLIVGSIANIIVVDQASRQGIRIGWGEHARVGVPVTLLTLALAGLWLWLVS